MNALGRRYFDSELFDKVTAKLIAGEVMTNLVITVPDMPVPLIPSHFVKCWHNDLTGISKDDVLESCSKSSSLGLNTRRHLRVSDLSNSLIIIYN